MPQYEMNLRDYVRIVKKRRLVIIVSTLLVGFLAFAFSETPPTKWEAMAEVRVSLTQNLADLLKQTLAVREESSLETEQHIITSQAVMVMAGARLGKGSRFFIDYEDDLRAGPITDAQVRAVLGNAEHKRCVDMLQKATKTKVKERTTIIQIICMGETPRESKEMASALAEAYTDYSNQQSAGRHRNYREQLAKALTQARRRLHDTGAQLERLSQRMTEQGAVGSSGLQDAVKVRQRLQSELGILRGHIGVLEKEDVAKSGLVLNFRQGDPTNVALARLEGEIDLLRSQRDKLFVHLTEASPQIQELLAQLRARQANVVTELRAARERKARELGVLAAQIRKLPETEKEMREGNLQYSLAERRYQELTAQEQQLAMSMEQEFKKAYVTRWPEETKRIRFAGRWTKTGVAGIIGLILGFFLAIVIEILDTSIDTIDDVEGYLDTPVLGVVPHIDVKTTREEILQASAQPMAEVVAERLALLVTQFDPKAPAAEAFRALRTNVEYARQERKGSTFLVTSAALSEGKTTVAANLGIALAQGGKKTLLVDADLRRPKLYRMFGVEKDPGFSDVIFGRVSGAEATRTITDVVLGDMSTNDIMRTPGLENLHILPSGPLPSNPAELLAAAAVPKFIEQLKAKYDIVLFDAPPVLPVTDSTVLARSLDGVLLVYQIGKVGRGALKRAKTQLDNVKASVWGVVLNDLAAEMPGLSRETEYYRQYYHKEEKLKAGLWSRVRGWRTSRRASASVRQDASGETGWQPGRFPPPLAGGCAWAQRGQ